MSPRNQLIELIEEGAIPVENTAAALAAAKIPPGGNAWARFVDYLLLMSGGLALAFAALFFVAYNWNDIGRFARFGMAEITIALAILVYWKMGAGNNIAKTALLVATLLLGVLLALYGQTYQTGADTWQLFFNWALLMLPWALIGRFSAIWIVWVTLINLSIVLYHQTFRGMFWFMAGSDSATLWLIFVFNTLALLCWEFLAARWHWLAQRWAIRLLAVGSGAPLTWLVLQSIFNQADQDGLPALVWVFWIFVLYFIYRKIKPDLFMLAGISLSVIVVVVSFFSRHLLSDLSPGSFLFLALLIIGLGSVAAVWLKNIHRELRE